MTREELVARLRKHAAPIHPGTGTDQSVHGKPVTSVGGKKGVMFDDRPSTPLTEDNVSQAARAIFEGKLEVGGMTIESIVSEATWEHPDGLVRVKGDLWNGTEKVGSYSRWLYWEHRSVTNSNFQINAHYQDRGIGTMFLSHWEDELAAAGFENMTVSAINYGSYAWAVAGYNWSPLYADKYANRLKNLLAGETFLDDWVENYSDEEWMDDANRLLERYDADEHLTPLDFALIGHEYRRGAGDHEMHFGKQFLFTSDGWSGIKTLGVKKNLDMARRIWKRWAETDPAAVERDDPRFLAELASSISKHQGPDGSEIHSTGSDQSVHGKRVFHGTTDRSGWQIIEDGWDLDKAGSHRGNVWGDGAYFAMDKYGAGAWSGGMIVSTVIPEDLKVLNIQTGRPVWSLMDMVRAYDEGVATGHPMTGYNHMRLPDQPEEVINIMRRGLVLADEWKNTPAATPRLDAAFLPAKYTSPPIGFGMAVLEAGYDAVQVLPMTNDSGPDGGEWYATGGHQLIIYNRDKLRKMKFRSESGTGLEVLAAAAQRRKEEVMAKHGGHRWYTVIPRKVAKHAGPGNHPSGSPQSVHGGDMPEPWRDTHDAQFTELVRTKDLAHYRQRDRHVDNPGRVSYLAEQIAEHGYTDPVILEVRRTEYGMNSRWADVLLVEGNHRLAVAEKLGHTHVPAKVLITDYSPWRGEEARKAARVTLKMTVEDAWRGSGFKKPSEVFDDFYFADIRKHSGPGNHPSGSAQTVHGNRLESADIDWEEEPAIPVRDVVQTEEPLIFGELGKVYRGTVADDQGPVVAYRGMTTLNEIRELEGWVSWRSRGKVIAGEAEAGTSFLVEAPDETFKDWAIGSWSTGDYHNELYTVQVAADIRGLKFVSLMAPENDTIKASRGLGLSVTDDIPLGRVAAIRVMDGYDDYWKEVKALGDRPRHPPGIPQITSSGYTHPDWEKYFDDRDVYNNKVREVGLRYKDNGFTEYKGIEAHRFLVSYEWGYDQQLFEGIRDQAEADPFGVLKHAGPGNHPSGSPQTVHAPHGGMTTTLTRPDLRDVTDDSTKRILPDWITSAKEYHTEIDDVGVTMRFYDAEGLTREHIREKLGEIEDYVAPAFEKVPDELWELAGNPKVVVVTNDNNYFAVEYSPVGDRAITGEGAYLMPTSDPVYKGYTYHPDGQHVLYLSLEDQLDPTSDTVPQDRLFHNLVHELSHAVTMPRLFSGEFSQASDFRKKVMGGQKMDTSEWIDNPWFYAWQAPAPHEFIAEAFTYRILGRDDILAEAETHAPGLTAYVDSFFQGDPIVMKGLAAIHMVACGSADLPLFVTKHMGPGPHPSGSPQLVHGRGDHLVQAMTTLTIPESDTEIIDFDIPQAPEKIPEGSYDEFRAKEKVFHDELKRRISLGQVSLEDADKLLRERGWRGVSTYGQVEPLPKVLYHVTTAKSGVLTNGLKTRDELAQSTGIGLGGGTGDTISFTDDAAMADTIYKGMLERHRVLNNPEVEIPNLIEQAKAGVGADKEWWSGMSNWTTDRIDGTLDEVFRNEHILSGSVMPQSLAEIQAKFTSPNLTFFRDTYDYSTLTPVLDSRAGTSDKYYKWKVGYTEKGRVEVFGDFMDEYSLRRDIAGGSYDPLFIFNDDLAFSKLDPSEIAVVKVKTKPGSHGARLDTMGEWRVWTGDVVDELEVTT